MTGRSSVTKRVGLWLWLLLALFSARVFGQFAVATWSVGFLPPMDEWFSGLIPYRVLFPAQLVIVAFLTIICLQFSLGAGWFVRPRLALGRAWVAFGSIYLAVMAVRYVVRMALYPAERWTGGAIPIFFHWVLAAFVLVVGRYHVRQGQPGGVNSKAS